MPKNAAKKQKAVKKTAPGNKPRKRQADKLPSRKERLAILQHDINAKFKGRVTIQTGDEFSNVFILRRPSGIISLDIAMGGGFPAGGLSQVVGGDSVGKDYLANCAIAKLQAAYGEDASIALAMTEMSYDKKYAKRCGVRIALTPKEIEDWQRALGRAFTPEELAWATEQVGTIHQMTANNAEELLEGTAQCIESNLYQIVLVNSFGALLTKAEEEAEGGIADKHYGGSASALTAFMHRVHAALNRPDAAGNPNMTSIVGINQYRDNLGPDARYHPLKISGGWALKHGKLIDILLQDKARIKITVNNQTFIVGKEMHWEILKGKAGCHDGPKGSYPFYFGEHGYPFGADVYQDLIVTGVQYGVINIAGPWISYNEDGFDLKAQGKENFSHLIANTDGAFDHLRNKCFEAANVHFIDKETNA